MKKITLLAMSLVMALTMKAQNGVDITSQLTNPDFEEGSTGWTVVGANLIAATAATYGYSNTNFMENWIAAPETLADLNWSQTIEVPNGVYVVRALAHAVMQSDASVVPSGVSIYANNDVVPVVTSHTNPPAEYSVSTVVNTGSLKVGFSIVSGNVNWAAWDNVRVMQYVADTEEGAKFLWLQDELAAMKTVLEGLLAETFQMSILESIEASIEAVDKVANYAEADALWATMKEQAKAAEESIEIYKALLATIESATLEVENGYPEGEVEIYAAIDEATSFYEDAVGDIAATEAAIKALNDAIFEYQMLNADGTIAFNVTDKFITNPTLRKGNQGWSGSGPGLEHEVMEFYDCDFDMYQTLTDVPNGMYVVRVQGFYRLGGNDSGAAYQGGSEDISAHLYANDESVPLLSLYKYTASEMGVTSSEVLNDYVNMRVSVNEAFNLTNPVLGIPYYAENELTVIVQNNELTIGLRNTGHASTSWCAFRDFKLEYYGNFPAVVLTTKIEEAEEWMVENLDILPSTAYDELSDACSEAMDYTGVGEWEEDVVMEVIAEFEAKFASAKNVVALVNKMRAMLVDVENLILLEYPGIDALAEAYSVAEPFAADGAVIDLTEGQTTEQFYEEAIATLQAAINAYYESQVATPDSPANYTHRIGLPNFTSTKSYTIPAPWVVANVQSGGDVWVGICQPEEAGGEGIPGLNSWSNNFTSMDVHQDIEGLPNGIYTVSAKAITQGLGQQHAYATSSVGTSVSPEMTIIGWDTPEWETLTTDKVVVVDGKLRIGFASISAGDINGWYQVTGFTLMYYGEASADDLLGAWETSLNRANLMASMLLPGDSKDVKDAIAAATPLADEGKYVEACAALNPVVQACDSVFNVVEKFYEGNMQSLIDLRAELDDEVNAFSAQVLDAVVPMAEALLKAEDATHKILDPLNAKLGGYLAYASYLVEAENVIATIKGVKDEDIAFVKNEVIAPQVADLVAEFRTADDCEDLLAKLKKAVQALQSFNNTRLPEGDLTSDLVVNPTIDDDKATGWTIVKGTGNGPTITGQHYDGSTSNRYIDSWNGTAGALNFTAYQEIVGLPDGTYQLTVASRTDGDNAWIFAAPQPLEADTAQWAEATQWAMIKKYYADHGEIWYADSLAFVASDGTIEAPYYNANNAQGWGWSYDTIQVEVTRHYLAIGVTANSELTCKEPFNGTWMGADDWKLELLSKAATQSDYNPFAGIENVEAVAPVRMGTYDLFGRRVDTPTVPGIYIVDGKKVVIKK